MSLSNEERQSIVTLELKKAYETYDEIGILTAADRWNGAANRLYMLCSMLSMRYSFMMVSR